jgi:hypothetical protein
MTKDEALDKALEALEKSVATCFDRCAHEQVMSRPEHFINQAITAIKQARALDKMAENARELGLDYEPVHKPYRPLQDNGSKYFGDSWDTPPAQQTCNCRWEGEVQVQQCTLHQAHVDAIHEWAERAKAAEAKLKAQPAPVQEPVGMPDDSRQDRDIGTAHALFSNLKKHGEQSALTAAFAHLWPSAFSHGFQSAKAIYTTTTTTPPAQPAPVQKAMPENWFAGMPEEYRKEAWRVATPPAAQRQWVGLSHEEVMDSWDEIRDGDWAPDFYAVIEAKLKEKNNG